MRENLSAPGTVSEWLRISRQALSNLDYYNIAQDPKYARLSARYGYEDYILVNIRNKDEDRVLLEFEVSSPKMVQQFKTASAQIIRQMQAEYRNKQEEKKYGPYPTPEPVKEEVDNTYVEEDESPYYTTPEYVAEEGDYIEKTRVLPDDTLTLKEYYEGIDRYETETFKEKFEYYFNRFWVIWLMLILLPPFGIFLIWYFRRMRLLTRILVTVIFFLYCILIWIGFFGVDTGFNREALQRFYTNQQYKITRYFNERDNASGLYDNPGANYSEETYTEEEETPYQDPAIQTPIQEDPHGFFETLDAFINSFFTKNSSG